MRTVLLPPAPPSLQTTLTDVFYQLYLVIDRSGPAPVVFYVLYILLQCYFVVGCCPGARAQFGQRLSASLCRAGTTRFVAPVGRVYGAPAEQRCWSPRPWLIRTQVNLFLAVLKHRFATATTLYSKAVTDHGRPRSTLVLAWQALRAALRRHMDTQHSAFEERMSQRSSRASSRASSRVCGLECGSRMGGRHGSN